jgi:hypothetical protein
MNYDGSGTVLSLGYGIDDDKVMEAMMKKRENGCKSCWTSTNDENGGSIGKRHGVDGVDDVFGGV